MLVAASSLWTSNAIAQAAPVVKPAAEKEKSNIELLSERSGTLLQRTYSDVGTVKSLQLQTLALTDLVNQKTVSGVVLEAYVAASYGGDTKRAFLDADELDGLLKAMGYISEQLLPKPVPTNYTEVSFTSRSGMSAGVYSDSKKGKWNAYVKLEKYDSRSTVFLTAEELIKLRDVLNQAKSKI